MDAYAVVENGKPLQRMELPTPEPQGEQVLLEVTHAGVCHSDLHIWEGEYDMGSHGKLRMADRGLVLPLVMGHEIVGRVAKLGPEAEGKGVAVGDIRLVYPWVGCGHCAFCQAEEGNMCATPRSLGVAQHGGYSSHVLAMSWRHLIEIDGLDPALAATYACSGVTVYSALRKILPQPPDEPIVIVGAGGLGMNAIAILRALGHRRICVVDISAEKLEAARRQGATETVLAGSDGTAEAIVAACGGPVIGIVDLVNGTQTARFALGALRKGGRLVQVGLFGGEMQVPLPLMPIRALTVQGTYVGNLKELREVVELARNGSLPPIPVSTEPMSEVNNVLNRLRDGHVVGRVILTAA
ncbi:alcohol dehydrogenase [Pseudoroseomonas rhizosphaerae]|uniref:alcohol dehydrogenase n=1 Tax=Teichococcus rhizosphaerae TaxID=1335062 RepID=A0A2C7AEI0_9PROT|nr:alcohol dehydrogenase [Pseudoroseomonas rhizosphaerae]PHK95484.1 alcohol dehydrogenase [Pseudoroseomonas rhizosphaerae]